MKIGIAGAGIGGLAAAALLSQDGHEVTVFDQFEAPKPVGSGLIVQPVGADVLKALGADQAIRLGQPIVRMQGTNVATGRKALDVFYGQSPEQRGLGIHRAALHGVLLEAAETSGATLEMGQRVSGREGQHLVIGDTRTAAFDVIVDASGAGSPLSPLTAKALPFGAIWATVPWPDDTSLPATELTQRYEHAQKMLGVLPLGGQMETPHRKQAAVFYSLPADGEAAWRASDFATWRAEVARLWPELEAMLPSDMGHDDFTFASYTHGTLRSPVEDGIVFIGDAAHRASPQLGQGANMALLDARALQLALRRGHGYEALRQFAGSRRWHLKMYQAASAAFTPLYQSNSKLAPILRDRLLTPLGTTPVMRKVLTRLVCGNLVPPMPALTPQAPSGERRRALAQ